MAACERNFCFFAYHNQTITSCLLKLCSTKIFSKELLQADAAGVFGWGTERDRTAPSHVWFKNGGAEPSYPNKRIFYLYSGWLDSKKDRSNGAIPLRRRQMPSRGREKREDATSEQIQRAEARDRGVETRAAARTGGSSSARARGGGGGARAHATG